jgi:cytochrome c556
VKKIRILFIIALTVASLCASLWVAWAENKSEDVSKERTFMRAKLTHSQKILEGLLAEDFEMLVANSQKLNLLTRAVEWQMLETAEYTQRSADFRRSVDKLTQAAKQKNLDGAALAYIDITIKCLQCHEYIRNM